MRIDESLRDVFDGLNESVYFLDLEGKIIFTNSMFSHRLGKSRYELEGRSIYDVVPADIVKKRRSCIDEVATTAKAMTYEEKRFDEVFLNSVSPILDSNGRVEAVAFVGTDITEQRRLMESLASVNERLEAFAHAVSHDIKGPLSAAFAAAETLRTDTYLSAREGADVPLDRVVEILISSLNRAFSLVDNLLMLAETGHINNPAEETRVSDVLCEILEEKQPQIKERGVSVEVSKDMGTMKIERTHIYQLLSNLISNSLAYNDNFSPVLSVRYLGQDMDGRHTYRIRDNGPGLPAELIDDIFEPFVKSKDGNAGLGLAIVKRIVMTHNGHVRAYNDNGAVFEFALKDV